MRGDLSRDEKSQRDDVDESDDEASWEACSDSSGDDDCLDEYADSSNNKAHLEEYIDYSGNEFDMDPVAVKKRVETKRMQRLLDILIAHKANVDERHTMRVIASTNWAFRMITGRDSR